MIVQIADYRFQIYPEPMGLQEETSLKGGLGSMYSVAKSGGMVSALLFVTVGLSRLQLADGLSSELDHPDDETFTYK